MKEEKQQFNVYLTPQTVKQMKHRSIDEQLSLSDLVEKVFTAYLSQSAEASPTEISIQQTQENSRITLQPILHVDDMGKAVTFIASWAQLFSMEAVMVIGLYSALALLN